MVLAKYVTIYYKFSPSNTYGASHRFIDYLDLYLDKIQIYALEKLLINF